MKNTFLLTALVTFMAVLAFMSFKEEKVTLASQKQLIDDLVAENVDIFRADKEAECRERALQLAMLEADKEIITAKTATPKPRGVQSTAISKPTSPKPTPPPTTTYTPPPPPTTTTTDTYTPPPTTTYTPPPTTTYTPPPTTTTTTTIPATTTTTTTTTITTPTKPKLGKGRATTAPTTGTGTTTGTTDGTGTTRKKPRLGKGKRGGNN